MRQSVRSILGMGAALALWSIATARADVVPVAVAVSINGAGTPTTSAPASQPYSHDDCVGPGVTALTAGPHVTHTDTVSGFVANGRIITFRVTTLNLFGAGICPTTVGGPVLPQDFTGRYHVTAVCADGTTNPGALFLDLAFDAIGGVIYQQGFNGIACQGFFNSPFSLKITIDISQTTLPIVGLPLDPIGGVLLTVTQ